MVIDLMSSLQRGELQAESVRIRFRDFAAAKAALGNRPMVRKVPRVCSSGHWMA